MDQNIQDYFSESSGNVPKGDFYRVIDLSEDVDIASEDLCKQVKGLRKGWVELAHLTSSDRIEFIRDFWISKFPFHPTILDSLNLFFSEVEDIGAYITQRRRGSPFHAHLVYRLKDEKGFFHGSPPAEESEILYLKESFPDHHLPEDYLAFLKIHNGFAKTTDSGILPLSQLEGAQEEFYNLLEKEGPLFLGRNQVVDPSTLFPFYKSFDMPVYQCFWSEWYPAEEIGNVYYSGLTHSISDIHSHDMKTESLAFPTFADWLFFYLEIM